ncbi:MAG: MFS transporter [Candidatus Hodarchaeota archaeon]
MIKDNSTSENQIVKQNYFKGYIIFWIGQLISLLGSNIVQFTIIWWITEETGSEFFLALAAFLGFGPAIVMTPIAGVFVDRWSRKKIIAGVDLLQAIATVILIFIFNFSNLESSELIWFVLVILTIRGLMQAFHQPAVEAIIPLLVPKDKLSRMNGFNYLFGGMIFLIGPVLGALLLEVWLIQEILWIDAITFVVAVIPTIIITIPSVIDKAKKEIQKIPFRVEFSEGFSFIKNKQGLFSLLFVFTAANFFLQPIFILLPLFVTKIHLGGATDLAFLMAIQQFGVIAGSILMSSWKGFRNNAHGVGIGLFFMYSGMFILALAPTNLAFINLNPIGLEDYWLKTSFLILSAGMFIIGFTLPIANVSSQTIWQKVVPPEKLGRVFSVRVTIAQISGPVAILLTGIIAGYTGIITLVLISGVLGVAFLMYSWLFTGFTKVEQTIQEKDEVTDSLPLAPPIGVLSE